MTHDTKGSCAVRRLEVLVQQLTSAKLQVEKQAIVCGGTVYDVQAKADVEVLAGSSVPGKVTHTPGGVARNIVDCLSQLLAPDHPAPILCTLLGDDVAGVALRASLQQLRLDLSWVQLVSGATTPTVVAILDRRGDLASCVADVRAVEQRLTPGGGLRALAATAFPKASLLICEANLSASSLEFLCRTASHQGIPIIFEPVSVPKSKRAVDCLPYLSYITPNARELAAIAEEVCRQSHEQFTLGPLLSAEQRDRSQGHEHAASPHARSAPSSGSHGLGSSAGAGCGAAGAPCEQYLQELACCAAVLLQKGTQHVVVTLGPRGAAVMSCGAGVEERLGVEDRPGDARVQSLNESKHAQHDRRAGEGEGLGRARGRGGGGGQEFEVRCVHLPALPPSSPVVSTSGAGDTLVGGLAAALLGRGLQDSGVENVDASVRLWDGATHGPACTYTGPACTYTGPALQHYPPHRALALGMAAATRAIQSHANVPSGLCMHELVADALRLLQKTTVRRFLVPLG